MKAISNSPKALALVAMLAAPTSAIMAQPQESAPESSIVVEGSPPSDLTGLEAGPKVEGFISARSGNKVRVTGIDGTNTTLLVGDVTQIRSRGGFLNASRKKLNSASLLPGLPASVETVQWGGGLVASKIDLKTNDLRTAAMIRNGTDQRFEEQTAATEALRGRMADIDKYNVKATTNVNFDTGKYNLTDQAKAELCNAAQQAQTTDNALLLVIGYTDSVGDDEYNQELSEKRATRVVNHLQQNCGWKPYRMLTPTGMAKADPLAPNDTVEGKAQNRRVAVNILVSKSVDGF